MFVAMILEAAFLWLLYITARWAVINPQLQENDMSTLYRAPKMLHSAGASRAFRSITILSITITLWFITRYGYHFAIFLLTWSTIGLVSFIFGLFDLFLPGIEISNIFPIVHITNIFLQTPLM